MISEISLRNFKSFQKLDLDLSPLTILIGPNGTGKSTVLQALGVAKGFIANPGRPLDGLFSLDGTNLGAFKDVVFRHNEAERLTIEIGMTGENAEVLYGLALGHDSSSRLEFKAPFTLKQTVSFELPFSPSETVRASNKVEDTSFMTLWDGLQVSAEEKDLPSSVELALNLFPKALQDLVILFARRGFYDPLYQLEIPTSTSVPLSDSQIASLLHDADVEEMVMSWTEDVFGVQVRAKETPPQITLVSRARYFSSKLVNEGLGLNQVSYIFAVLAAAPEDALICVEEPEISLHPSAQYKLAKIFMDVLGLRKHLLISTHSEHLLTAFLTQVAKGKLDPEHLAIYSFEKRGFQSKAAKLEVNEKGQVSGGLKDFFEHEMASAQDYIQALEGRS